MMARPTDVRDARDLARAMAEDKRRAGSVPPTGASRPVDESTSAGRKAEQAEKAGPAPKTRRQRRSLWFVPSAVNAKLIYAGYLASLAIPFTALISAFFAYQSSKQSPPEWLESHYIYQMRTFWIGLVANVIAFTFLRSPVAGTYAATPKNCIRSSASCNQNNGARDLTKR